jgi:hypothetical protein
MITYLVICDKLENNRKLKIIPTYYYILTRETLRDGYIKCCFINHLELEKVLFKKCTKVVK